MVVNGRWKDLFVEPPLVASTFLNSPEDPLRRAAMNAPVRNLEWLKAGRQVEQQNAQHQ